MNNKEEVKMTPPAGYIPVLITTDHNLRGVFKGFIDPADITKDTLIAYRIQMCIKWSEAMHGVLGLAAMGPDADCRITPITPKGTIYNIKLIIELTPEALVNWEKCPWG